MIDKKTYRHKEYTIKRCWSNPRFWSYVHDDYDGPEDARIGLGTSPEDCVEQIEDWIASPIWPKPDAWSGGFADNH